MGRYDVGGNRIWINTWNHSGGDAGGAGFFQRGGDAVHYNARNLVFLDGADADRQRVRSDRENDERDPTSS